MTTLLPDTSHGAAAALADLGLWVFSVAGKKPYKGTRGLHDATRAFDMIDTMFRDRPGAGVAVATGELSGVWVLDSDGEEGVDSLRCLVEEFGPLPETVTARTRNGAHRFFQHVEGVRNSAGKIAAGIDVRGTGGYVVVAPSPHPDGGAYRWVRDPFNHSIADAPQWLLDLVLTRPPETFREPRELPDIYGDRYVRVAIEAECAELARTPEGSRNHQLNSAAYSLARFVAAGKVDVGTVARALAYAGARAGLSRQEIERTIRSAFTARGVA